MNTIHEASLSELHTARAAVQAEIVKLTNTPAYERNEWQMDGAQHELREINEWIEYREERLASR